MENPWFILVGLLIAAVGWRWWWQDYEANRRDDAGVEPPEDASPPANRLPGAHPTTYAAVLIAVAGALLLLAAETASEIGLGVSEEQSKMTLLFALYTVLAASLVEELIFRGYLFYDRGGRAGLVLSCVGFSLLFALIHPYLWEYHADVPWLSRIELNFSTLALTSTLFVFVKSLWFYAVRFFPLNPRRSLIPCFAAHMATNAGVFAVKVVQGHFGGWLL